MSTQNGPNWYPSKQFVHNPPPPMGAPSHPGRDPELKPAADAEMDAPKEPGVFRRFVDKFIRRSGKADGV